MGTRWAQLALGIKKLEFLFVVEDLSGEGSVCSRHLVSLQFSVLWADRHVLMAHLAATEVEAAPRRTRLFLEAASAGTGTQARYRQLCVARMPARLCPLQLHCTPIHHPIEGAAMSCTVGMHSLLASWVNARCCSVRVACMVTTARMMMDARCDLDAGRVGV